MALSNPLLHEIFEYDPATGLLTNKIKRNNSVVIGAEAGFENGNGYRRVGMNGRQFYVHHVIWAMHSGEWPANEIDHIDGNPRNNRVENLRPCDRTKNNQNTRQRAHSRQPYKGIHRNPNGRWVARIVSNKTMHRLGAYNTAEEAYTAYCRAAVRLHGEFARVT